jgi:hypothetical protein
MAQGGFVDPEMRRAGELAEPALLGMQQIWAWISALGAAPATAGLTSMT